jgi:hypothetical protein
MLMMSPSIRLAKSQDGGVLLDVEQGSLFSLNPVGARVVELLKTGQDLSSLADIIGCEFHISPEVVRSDIADFLMSLRDQHLLTDGEPGDRSERGDAQ